MTEITKNYSKFGYRPEIDGLRALAVIAVILNHFNNSILPSGYLGVDIFFVISGFVITASLTGRSETSFRALMLSFYARRIKRLMPALVTCVVVTGVLISLVNPNPGASLKTGIASLFGLSNFYLLKLATDYFGVLAKFNAFTQTWSLGVEEQFYLLFPFLFWFSGFGVGKHGRDSLFFRITAVSVALSLVLFIYLNRDFPDAAYYLMPARLWELGVGCLLFLGLYGEHRVLLNLRQKINPLFVASILISALFIPQEFNISATIIVVLLSALLIATLQPGTLACALFSRPTIVYIGRISYSLYLWHWTVFSISHWTIGVSWEWMPFQFLAIFILSVLSYHGIEKPLRRAKWSNGKLRVIGYGFVGSIGAAIFLAILGKPLNGTLFLGKQRVGGVAVHEKLNCHKGVLEECIARKGDGTNLYLIGDSHLSNIVPSITKAVESRDISVSYFGGISFIRTIFNLRECSPEECYKVNVRRITSYLSTILHKGDVIVFSMSRNRLYLPEHYAFRDVSRNGEENTERVAYLREALKDIAESIVAKGAKLVLVDDIPSLCSSDDITLSSFSASACVPSREVSLNDRMPLTAIYKKLADKSDSIFYLDPHETLCPESTCMVVNNGEPIYVDASPHFSIKNEYILAPFFKEKLLPILQANSRP